MAAEQASTAARSLFTPQLSSLVRSSERIWTSQTLPAYGIDCVSESLREMKGAAQECDCVQASGYYLSLGRGGTGELMCSEIRTNMHIPPHSSEVRGPVSADVGLGQEAPTRNVPHPPSPLLRGGNNSRTETKTRLPAGSELLIVLPGPSSQEAEQASQETGQSSVSFFICTTLPGRLHLVHLGLQNSEIEILEAVKQRQDMISES